MIVRAKDDLTREISAMRDSYLDGRSLVPVADAMQSALDEAMQGDPDYARQNELLVSPVGPQLVANPAVQDLSKDEALRPMVEGAPEQTAPGTALTEEHLQAAADAGAVNVDISQPTDVAQSTAPATDSGEAQPKVEPDLPHDPSEIQPSQDSGNAAASGDQAASANDQSSPSENPAVNNADQADASKLPVTDTSTASNPPDSEEDFEARVSEDLREGEKVRRSRKS